MARINPLDMSEADGAPWSDTRQQAPDAGTIELFGPRVALGVMRSRAGV